MSASQNASSAGRPGGSILGSADRRIVEIVALAAVWLLVGIVALPVVLQERAADWTAYAAAAAALRTAEPLYPWAGPADIRAVTSAPYLYPPLFAAVWGLGLTATAFAVAKVGLVLVATWVAAAQFGASVPVSLGLGLLVLAFPPFIHDLMLGNVTVLYLAAVLISSSRRGWLGSSVLGLTCASVLKPMIGPYLLWLLIVRPADFARTVVVGAAATVVAAIILGPSRYAEYLAAIPYLTGLAAPFTGNVGLSSLSTTVAIAGLLVAYAWTALGSLCLPSRPACAIALSMTLLAQPTIGFNYAIMLLPALGLIWVTDRRAGLYVGLIVPVTTLISPIAGAIIVAIAATVVGLQGSRGDRPWLTRRQRDGQPA